MILRKSLSLLGIGSAQIDLILRKDTYRPGEQIQGYFSIKGGTIEQQIKRVDCELVMKNRFTGLEQVMDTTAILQSKLIHAEECDQLPFTYRLPVSLPVSTKEITYYFRTTLTFDEGVESRDQDPIQIV